MRIVIVGPGRAGLALAIAAGRTGHEVAAVVGRDADHAGAGAALVGSTAARRSATRSPTTTWW